MLEEYGEDYGIEEIQTYKNAGVLTNNYGLLIIDSDGQPHHIELVGSF
jgi:hypothetical protein